MLTFLVTPEVLNFSGHLFSRPHPPAILSQTTLLLSHMLEKYRLDKLSWLFQIFCNWVFYTYLAVPYAGKKMDQTNMGLLLSLLTSNYSLIYNFSSGHLVLLLRVQSPLQSAQPAPVTFNTLKIYLFRISLIIFVLLFSSLILIILAIFNMNN